MQTEFNHIEPEQLKACLLSGDELKQAASVLYLAYHDDPLFMEIFRADKADYEQRLRAAIREELSAFWQSQQPFIGLFHQQQLLGVACLTGPDSGAGAGRVWLWRLKMLLTAGYVSTRQLLEKEQKIHAAMPQKHYHTLAFIAVSPKYQHLGLGQYLLRAAETIIDKDSHSAGVGVFVSMDKYQKFFADNHYKAVTELVFGRVSGTLMFRAKTAVAG
ncbi:GNAT family N-acetyltransferase [Chromatiaceae bacterium AAb-1]|nr:GNAT family N-acetyltransferase [Chromatiaceae bacterium AAb-1]